MPTDMALMPTGEMMAGRQIKPTVTESLEREKKSLLERLADIEEALAALRAHPEIQSVIDILSKHTRY